MLPNPLVTTLTPLVPRLPAIRNTVTSLSALVARVDALANLPTAPTACALFILALEGELSASLPNAGALAQALGARVGASKAVVMQRYKAIYDVVEEYAKEVPWLDSHERKAGGKGRPKVGKRAVAAKGLKDVVQFQEEIWRRKFEGAGRPSLTLETDCEEDDETSTEGSVFSFGPTPSVSDDGTERSAPGAKKRKTQHERHVAEVSRLMLEPHTLPSTTEGASSRADELFRHFLTMDGAALSHAFVHPPTRLQLLSSSLGGEDRIGDEDLFDEGELEGFLRNVDEVDAFRRTIDWEEDAPASDGTASNKRKRSTDDTGDAAGQDKSLKKGRIDMDALARLLDPPSMEDGDGCDSEQDDDGVVATEGQLYYKGDAANEEVVEEWRPMSPGGGFDDERYDI